MCYSAKVRQDLKYLSDRYAADVDWESFEEIFERRLEQKDVKVAHSLELSFLNPASDVQRRTKGLIDTHHHRRASEWEEEIFKQRRRLAGAEASLQTKETKRAREDVRIAGNKISLLLDRLGSIRRTQPNDEDRRIFPMMYAPVLVNESGRTIVRPMRYTCRLSGKPANYDVLYPGTYNARRESLDDFWDQVYGRRHAVMVIDGFYENVPRHLYEHRVLQPGETQQNVVLEFDPRPRTDLLVACLWDHWKGASAPDLDSFAAITDVPPSEIAATGHQRCVITIREKNLSAWLSPEGADREDLERLLSDREDLYYEHQIAA